MGNFKKLAQKRLFLPVFSMILVMLINKSVALWFFLLVLVEAKRYWLLLKVVSYA